MASFHRDLESCWHVPCNVGSKRMQHLMTTEFVEQRCLRPMITTFMVMTGVTVGVLMGSETMDTSQNRCRAMPSCEDIDE